MQCLVRMDNGEGIVEGPQHNTLDQPWFGKIAWLSSLYVAAARACEEMANELGDEAYARQMRQIAERGGRNIDRELFNGEYYVQIPDKDHVKTRRLAQRLRDRSGLRAELGLPGRAGTNLERTAT